MAAAVEAASGGGAGQELLALSARSTELAQERAALRAALAGEAAAAYHAASQALGAGSTGLPVPAGVPALVAELRELQLAEAQLLQLQVGRRRRPPSRPTPTAGRHSPSPAALGPAGSPRSGTRPPCRCCCGSLRGARGPTPERCRDRRGVRFLASCHPSAQDLQSATRHRERAVRAVEKAHAAGDAAGLLRAVSEAVQAGLGGGAGDTSVPGAAAAAEGSVLGRLQGHAARLGDRASQVTGGRATARARCLRRPRSAVPSGVPAAGEADAPPLLCPRGRCRRRPRFVRCWARPCRPGWPHCSGRRRCHLPAPPLAPRRPGRRLRKAARPPLSCEACCQRCCPCSWPCSGAASRCAAPLEGLEDGRWRPPSHRFACPAMSFAAVACPWCCRLSWRQWTASAGSCRRPRPTRATRSRWPSSPCCGWQRSWPGRWRTGWRTTSRVRASSSCLCSRPAAVKQLSPVDSSVAVSYSAWSAPPCCRRPADRPPRPPRVAVCRRAGGSAAVRAARLLGAPAAGGRAGPARQVRASLRPECWLGAATQKLRCARACLPARQSCAA